MKCTTSKPVAGGLQPSGPLWKRVPTQTDQGEALCDFMILVRGFRGWTMHKQEAAVTGIERCLERFSQRVVFADFNRRTNILWVSHRATPGLMSQLLSLIQTEVPEAVLVANQAEVMMGAQRKHRVFKLLR